MPQKRESTTDAVEILHRRYFEGKPEMMELLEEEHTKAEIARQIYDLRTEAGLTQQELAKLLGTDPSVIDGLEEADYEGNALVAELA
jgi:ribosome-binding protein aMBF1 (putative translation factor)